MKKSTNYLLASTLCLLLIVLFPNYTKAQGTWDNIFAKPEKQFVKGKYKKAISQTPSALKKARKKFKGNEIYTVWGNIYQAKSLEATADYTQMEQKIEAALQDLQKFKNSNLIDYSVGVCRAVDIYLQVGYYAKAENLLNGLKQEWSQRADADKVISSEMSHRQAIIDVYTGKLNETLAALPNLSGDWLTLSNEKNWNQLKLSSYDTKYRKVQYARLLSLAGELFSQKGDYDKADSVFRRNANTIKSSATTDPVYTRYLLSIGDNFFAAEDYKKAERAYEQALGANKKYMRNYPIASEKTLRTYILNEKEGIFEKSMDYFGKVLNTYFKGENVYQLSKDLLNAEFLTRKEDTKTKAKEELNKILNASESALPAIHPLRLQVLENIYTLNAENDNDLKAAKENLENSTNIHKELYGENSVAYKARLIDLAGYYIVNSDDYDKAKEILAAEPQKAVFEQRSDYHKDFVRLSNYIADYYDASDNYKESLALLQKATDVTKKKYGDRDLLLGKQLGKLAEMQLKVGDYKGAEVNMQTAMKIIRREVSRKSLEYADALAIMARVNGIIGLYDEAETLLKKSSRIYRKLRTEDISQKAKSVEETAFLYIRIGEYAQTEELLKEAIKDKEAKYGKTSRRLINPLNQLALLYVIKGDYKEAEKDINRAADIAQKIYGKESVKYAESLSVLSKLYNDIGDYESAEKTINQVLTIQRKQLGENHVEVGNSLTDLALIKFNQDKKNAPEAEKLLDKAKNIMAANFDNKHPLYAEVLKNIGTIYVETERYQDAFKFLNEANAIWLEKIGDRNINSANVYLLNGDIFAKLKNFKEAEENYNKAENIFRKKFNKEHPKYLKTLSKLGQMYFINFDYNEATKKLTHTTKSYLNYIKNYFPALSEREKSKFWNLIRTDFEFFNTLAIKQIDSRPDLIEDMYNYTLATKALLLSSSIKVRQRILNGKDEDLKAKYKEWVDKKEYLTSILAMSDEELVEDGISPEAIQLEINKLEKELSERSELFAQSFENKDITWKDVRKTLKEGEAAVEVIRFRLFENGFTDKIKYAALIVSPDTKKIPKLVLLEDGKGLEDKFLRYYRNAIKFRTQDKYSYKNYWQPIENELAGASKVFLSPDGAYNQINVESLLIDEEKYVIDKTNVRVVSNTKDLVINDLKKDKKKKKTSPNVNKYAILFGNPTFYASADISERDISSLPGTEAEIQGINQRLKQNNWKVDVFTETIALEQAIKDFNSPRVFHIATHGFFAPNEKVGDLDVESTKANEDPLRRSGLLAQGAGDLLAKTSTNFNLKDGILTAYEAMSLNFDDTELVVMSACETGVGEVQIGEGVFGLQRAFLVAGADALVMSLFKVSDDITQKLMDKFYEKWLATGDKRKAFNEAQKEIKEEYKYPSYWGAFNMIGVE